MLQHQQILPGHTMHWRRTPEAEHRFHYPVLYFRLPVNEKISETRLFKHERFSLYSFFNNDHGDKNLKTNTLNECFRCMLSSANVDMQLLGSITRVELITQPRVLGFVFNPVSFWLAYDFDEKLKLVIAEVNNTFGERLSYLLQLDDALEITSQHLLHTKKKLHVSPFFEVKGDYIFQFSLGDNQVDIVIKYYRDTDSLVQDKKSHTDTPSLIATMHVKPLDFTDSNLLKSFFRFGFSSLVLVARIHWQAIKLKLKGAKFYRSPKETEQD